MQTEEKEKEKMRDERKLSGASSSSDNGKGSCVLISLNFRQDVYKRNAVFYQKQQESIREVIRSEVPREVDCGSGEWLRERSRLLEIFLCHSPPDGCII